MSLLARLERHKDQAGQNQPASSGSTNPRDPLIVLKGRIHEQLVSEIDSKLLKSADQNDKNQELKTKVEQVVQRVIHEEQANLSRAENLQLLQDIIDEVTGFGPINSLILNPDISEVMVNGPKQVFVERSGRLELTDITFRDHEHVLHIIDKIVAPLGRRIDESSPMVDARLPDGSRVNAIIPPLALNGPTITIRSLQPIP